MLTLLPLLSVVCSTLADKSVTTAAVHKQYQHYRNKNEIEFYRPVHKYYFDFPVPGGNDRQHKQLHPPNKQQHLNQHHRNGAQEGRTFSYQQTASAYNNNNKNFLGQSPQSRSLPYPLAQRGQHQPQFFQQPPPGVNHKNPRKIEHSAFKPGEKKNLPALKLQNQFQKSSAEVKNQTDLLTQESGTVPAQVSPSQKPNKKAEPTKPTEPAQPTSPSTPKPSVGGVSEVPKTTPPAATTVTAEFTAERRDYRLQTRPKFVIQQAGPSQQFGWVGHGSYAPLNIPNVFKAAGLHTKWLPGEDKVFQAGLLYPPAKSIITQTYSAPAASSYSAPAASSYSAPAASAYSAPAASSYSGPAASSSSAPASSYSAPAASSYSSPVASPSSASASSYSAPVSSYSATAASASSSPASSYFAPAASSYSAPAYASSAPSSSYSAPTSSSYSAASVSSYPSASTSYSTSSSSNSAPASASSNSASSYSDTSSSASYSAPVSVSNTYNQPSAANNYPASSAPVYVAPVNQVPVTAAPVYSAPASTDYQPPVYVPKTSATTKQPAYLRLKTAAPAAAAPASTYGSPSNQVSTYEAPALIPAYEAPAFEAPALAPAYEAPVLAPAYETQAYEAPAIAQTYEAPAIAPTYEAPEFEGPASAPAYEAPAFEAQAIAPAYEAPTFEAPALAPAYEVPAFEAPALAPVYEVPAFEAPALAPAYEAPAFEAPALAPAYEAPAFEAPALAPAYEGPAYEAPALAPAYEVPAPAAEKANNYYGLASTVVDLYNSPPATAKPVVYTSPQPAYEEPEDNSNFASLSLNFPGSSGYLPPPQDFYSASPSPYQPSPTPPPYPSYQPSPTPSPYGASAPFTAFRIPSLSSPHAGDLRTAESQKVGNSGNSVGEEEEPEVFYIYYENENEKAQEQSGPVVYNIPIKVEESGEGFTPPSVQDIRTIYVPLENAINIPDSFDINVGTSFGYNKGNKQKAGFPNFPSSATSFGKNTASIADTSETSDQSVDIYKTAGATIKVNRLTRRPEDDSPYKPNYKYSPVDEDSLSSIPFGTRLGPRHPYDPLVEES